MVVIAIDTLKIARRLREVGFSDPQAEAVVASVQEAAEGADLATKPELDAAVTALRSELREMQLRLEAKIDQVRLQLEAKIEAVIEQLERQSGIDLETGTSQGLDRVGRRWFVVFVVDRTDQLLEQVFQGQQPGNTAILV